MNSQLRLRWIAVVTAAATALAIGQASAQTYYSSPDYGNDYGHSRIVRCESNDGRSTFCRVNTNDQVWIERQLSHRDCIQGYTWNYNDRGIWVSDGCRADFAVRSYGRTYRHDRDYDDYYRGYH